MNHLITICARGGSKGIPGKNIRPLNGKPLIGYTVEAAKALAKEFEGVIALSSDSREIIETASQFGLKETYVRPPELGGDQTGKIDVLAALLNHYEQNSRVRFDYIWDLDVTSPLRTQEDLLVAYKKLLHYPDALNIFSVSPASKNPYFNMVEEKEDGYVGLCKKADEIHSRQSSPVVYEMNASFYIYRRAFFDLGLRTSTTDRSLHYLMPHICFDIDEPVDFEIMEHIIQNNLHGFPL